MIFFIIFFNFYFLIFFKYTISYFVVNISFFTQKNHYSLRKKQLYPLICKIKALDFFNYDLESLYLPRHWGIHSSLLGLALKEINIRKSCKQGNLISPYLFILQVEAIACNIRNTKNIKRIRINDTDFDTTQFPDDICFFVGGG